jgi:hypothetical protein
METLWRGGIKMSNQPNPNVFFRGEDMGIGNFPIKGGTINDKGPAFPRTGADGHTSPQSGMTLRQYAAIKLRVPDSETDWLDDMIRKSNRDYFAAAALQPLVTSAIELDHVKWDATAQHAYLIADAMLKAREGK